MRLNAPMRPVNLAVQIGVIAAHTLCVFMSPRRQMRFWIEQGKRSLVKPVTTRLSVWVPSTITALAVSVYLLQMHDMCLWNSLASYLYELCLADTQVNTNDSLEQKILP